MQLMAISIVGFLFVAWIGFRLYRKNRHARLNISPRKTLLESKVREVKQRIELAMGEDYELFPQVRLADLLVYEAAEDKASQAAIQRIESSTVDFVLTEKLSGKISCVLMLSRHDKPGSRQLFVRQVCHQSELPFLLFDVHNALSDKQIRQKIMALLEPTIVMEESAPEDIKVYLEPIQRHKQKQKADVEA